MQFLKNISKVMRASESLEDSLYASVLNEVQSGMVIKDLWAKSLAHGDFDPDKTRAFYIRERVSRLKKKSKAINEYLKLFALEADLRDESSEEQRHYVSAIEKYKKKLKDLEVKRQRLVNKITVEQVSLSSKKNEVVTTIRFKESQDADKEARDKKVNLTVAAVAAVVTGITVIFGAHPMAIAFAGLIAFLAFVSAFVSANNYEGQIESAKKTLDDESHLNRLKEQRENVVEQISDLRQQEPDLKIPDAKHDGARKSELEKELQHLFDLEPINADL